ncbi:hypothetical protein GGI43DRAFT_399484 [Trichoderma evansii]
MSPAAAMYAIFTSGSTGNPKGVIISHTSYSSSLEYQPQLLGFTAESRVFDFASYTFDISIQNLFATLSMGGCLCVPSEDDRQNNITKAMAEMRVTLANLTPSVARLINPAEVPQLQTLILAGEAVVIDDITQWWSKVHIINGYGPGECCNLSVINLKQSAPEEVTSIGKAIGLVAWIVSPEDHNKLLPPGCVGELLLEGPLIARGYLNDPDKTATAFIKDPAWLLEGALGHPGRSGRLYKTGDLVRYNKDGSLAFIGRKDIQVKINGQRVELGDVEHWVQVCMPEATRVIVEVISPSGEGSAPTLTAFLQIDSRFGEANILNNDGDDDISFSNANRPEATAATIYSIPVETENKLAQYLPRYMVPSAFLSMQELPVTATGKINRKQLREIGSLFSAEQLAETWTAKQGLKRQPTSRMERQLQRIWSLVLGIKETKIGLDDNFFQLGGNSIVAMKTVGEARKIGIQLSVADVFRRPLLHDLANHSVNLHNNDLGVIQPFDLVREKIDVDCFLQDTSAHYQLGSAKIIDAYPCTPLQEGLVSLTSKQSGDYIVQSVFDIFPDVKPTDLQMAWERVFRATPILRTRFIPHSELGLVQVVLDERIPWIDATDLDEYLKADSQRPMELGAPFTRFALVKDSSGTIKSFVWTIHHALYDGWSMPLIQELVNRAYKGESIEPDAQFQSFIRYVQDQDHQTVSDYWQKYLVDYKCPPFPNPPSSLGQPITDGIIEYSLPYPQNRRLCVTPSMLIRAAWALVAGRTIASDDITFGVTVSGRSAPVIDLDKMIGPTIATVPVRVQLDKGQTILEYLHHLQRQSTEMIPFEQTGLRRIAKISTDTQTACMFQTLLIVQPQDNGEDRSLLGKYQDNGQRHWFSSYSLTLEFWLGTDEIKTSAIFDSRVIEPWMVQNLLQRLDFVLRQLDSIDIEQRTLADIQITTQEDLGTIWNWNAIVPPPAEQSVYQIIAEQVQARPEAPAICSWDGELTYGKLDELSTLLAGRLLDAGIGPNILVPLCFEKSMWTTVAILAVIKTGGGFVLLDPSLPEQRLKAIAQQVEGSLILCSRSTQQLGSRLGKEMIIDQSMFEAPKAEGGRHIDKNICPSSILYIVFTSGSTGTPKGAMITYQNAASALRYHVERLGLTPESRTFDLASYSVDVSISNVLTILAAGGCLCVPSDEDRSNNIEQSIISLRANTIDITPSVAQLLTPANLTGVQLVIFGGEALRLSEIKRWWGKARVIHEYGSSECTQNSTINHNASTPEEVLQIGSGAGLLTWIVDPENHNELLPPGCIGELLLEGPLVGRGYLHDEEKTAAVFINDPDWLLQGMPGRAAGRHGLLYKTGDLVQYNENGSLTIIGRKDSQVKIRGQRVELGEVEYWVQNCIPDVTRVAAEIIIPREDDSSQMLVAFLEMNGEIIEANETEAAAAKVLTIPKSVEDRLAQCLPRHMVPTTFFTMKELPVRATGKLDRRFLREIASSFSAEQLAEMRTAGQGPKRRLNSQAECQLQRIWSQVLHIAQSTIGLDDSFFHVGGDSITAMKVVAEARKAGVKLAVSDVFQYPLLEDLASRCIYTANNSSQKVEELARFALVTKNVNLYSFLQNISSLYKLDPTMISDAYPCTPLQEGLISLTSKRPGDYITQIVLEFLPSVNASDLRLAWEQVSRAMPILRTRFVQHSEMGLMQVVLDEPICWISATNLDAYLEADITQPMDLGDPLTRYALVQDDTGTQKWLVWTIHHSLYDGWSMNLLIDAAHRAFMGQQVNEGPQFQSFIQYIRNQGTESVENYWRNSLANYDHLPFPILPPSVDQPVLDKETRYEITQHRRFKDITTPNLVRAAWALVSGHMGGSEDVVFGATVSGRNAPVVGIEAIAAPTFATVPVRVKLSSTQRATDYLEMVQQQAVDMIPFEQIGLHQISNISLDSQKASAFQTLLVIQPKERSIMDDSSYSSLGTWRNNSQQALNTYALILEIHLGEEHVTIEARFDTRVLEPSVVDRLLKQLEFVMHQLDDVRGTQKLLKDITMVAPSDLEQIWGWNGTVPISIEKCAHEMIAEQTRTRPTAPAVCAWDGELTYQELDQLSSRLVGRLIHLGVKPDTLVPLCFEKSMWTIVAVLGVLKAGGGFVLLESSLPEHRLQTIIQQINPPFILSSTSKLSLSSRLLEKVVELGPGSIEVFESSQVQVQVSPAAIMFAIFTSGSTGTPKGVVQEHRTYCSALEYQSELFGFRSHSRVYDFASYAFDISLHNIFSTLVMGGCLCIPSERDRIDNLSMSMAAMGATLVNLTSSVARLINPTDVPQLQTLVLAGEAVSINDVTRWWGKVQIVNAYGPAECNVSTLNSKQSAPEEAIHIGKGLGLVTWIVDPEDHDSLMPPGCVGELLLEGPLVGRGYLNEPEKTAASFIHDPVWLLQGSPSRPGRHGRVYKTGDLVRYDEDGNLIFVSRKDTQVKIRGQRVELGEVESAVLKFIPEARQAVVEIILPQGENSGPALAAFVRVDRVPEAAKPTLNSPDIHILPDAMEVKRQLALYLPKYMIPETFLLCPQLPMTATGKINRRGIRELGGSLSWAAVEQSSDALGSLVAASGGPIPSTEQPAYELAQKIFKMIPSWHQCGLASKKYETTFDDVLLLYSGLDSVNMMTLIYFISQQFQVKVGMQLLLDPTTSIRSLARFISDLRLGSSGQTPLAQPSASLNLIAEIDRHDASIVTAQREGLSLAHANPKPTSRDNKPLAVLLTGASGFIGTQILRQLLEHHHVGSVIAIVRGQNTSAARSRTIDSAKRALWWTDAHEEKLVVWSGDLSLPNLGLDPTHWGILADGKTVDIFIHNAAVVHWGRSYAALMDANVKSTVQLLHLAVGSPNARFVYVTGGRMSVMEDEREEDVARELVTAGAADADGYGQTKFVAESVVRRAALRCPSGQSRLAVAAPGLVIGTPAEGVPNADDYIWRLVAACIRTRSYNADDSDEWLPMSDVAAMATMIIDTALDPTAALITKSRDGMTWGEFWAIIQEMGYQLQGYCAAEWLAAVREDIEISREKHPLWPVAYMLDTEGETSKGTPDSSLEMGNTPERLKLAVRKNVEFLGRVGFIPHSPATPEDVKRATGMQAFSRSLAGSRAV